MKKKAQAILSAMLVLTSFAACGTSTSQTDADATSEEVTVEVNTNAEKPESITIMVDGTLITQENGRDEFEKKWEDLTGIDLIIIQPEHDVYYDEVNKVFETTDLPDVVLLSSTYYTTFAAKQLLADITPYYTGSELESKVNGAGKSSLVDGLKINGKLYGFSPTRGNGCTTYIKKAWLDRVGLDVPTNFDEYMEMLKAFSEGDPDGDGVAGNTYGVSAAGLINNEAPYVNYLPEFYQDAYPSFYQKDDGTWADGFMEDSMRQALSRMRQAFASGYMDPDIVDNGTGDCRDKYYANEYGVFTYWAGTWAQTISDKLVDAGVDGEIVTMAPLPETGAYLERVAPVWCITSKCKNPAGVYKYFIETMNDGGDVELLWTYKPDSEDFSKNHIDHMLATVSLTNDPGADSITARQAEAMQIFNDNSKMADLPYSTDAYSLYNDPLMELKKELVKKVVVDGMDMDAAYSEFEGAEGVYMSQAIVDSLNAE